MTTTEPLTRAPSEAEAEAEVRAVIDAHADAMRTADADALVAQTTPDVVVYNLAPPLRQPDTGPQGLRAWFGTFEGPPTYEVRDLQITVGGDVAFCTSLDRMGATAVHGGPFELWFRTTVGLRRLDGAWRITHQHSSTPFLMDGSLKAAVELTPDGQSDA